MKVDIIARGDFLDIVALGLERAAADHDDLLADFGEHQGFLDRGIAAAGDGDILAAEKAAIAGGAARNAAAGEFFFAWHAEFAQDAPEAMMMTSGL